MSSAPLPSQPERLVTLQYNMEHRDHIRKQVYAAINKAEIYNELSEIKKIKLNIELARVFGDFIWKDGLKSESS